MSYSRNVFACLMPQIDSFVKHLLCHRAVQRKGGELLNHPFWSLTSDAHLLQAIVAWCKVFGATGTNETHWQNLATTDAAELRDSFRAALFSELGLNAEAWSAYHTEVTDFRNKYAAHTEGGFSMPVPKLDLALDIALLFDRWVRVVISPDTLAERPLFELAPELDADLEAHIEFLSSPTAPGGHLATS